jgi:hypothetical protein
VLRQDDDVSFSWVGLAIGLAVLAPNLLLLRFPPRDGMRRVPVPLGLTILERAGQAGCLALVAFPLGEHPWWLVGVTAAELAYLALWARYLLRGRTFALLYRRLGPLPVPMAVFPVLAFGLAAAWGASPWLAVATVVLAAGHIPASWLIARTVTA